MQTQNFWDDKLYQDEKILKDFSVGKGYIYYYLILSTIIFLLFFSGSMYLVFVFKTYVFLIMTIIIYVGAIFYFIYYLPASYRYALTNKRVLIKEGWANTHTITIDYDSITDIRVYSSIINKIFCKTAVVYINTAGGKGVEGTLKNIQDPYEIKKLINQQTNLYKYQKPTTQTYTNQNNQ